MSLFENKTITILVVVNAISLMVIFWFVGLYMGENRAVSGNVSATALPPPPPVVAPVADVIERPGPFQMPEKKTQAHVQKKVTLSEVIVSEVNASEEDGIEQVEMVEPVMIEKTTTIDIFYDGTFAQIEKTDQDGNRIISISNDLKEVEKLSESDESYLAEYRKMKSGKIGHMSIYKVTKEQAMTSKVQPVITEEAVDYFNKVDVSEQSPHPDNNVPLSLAQKISLVVADKLTEAANVINKKKNNVKQEQFIASLQSSSQERQNETRTVRVKLGDSLWLIAVRAYGSGYQYPKIYKANPHIKNPNMIRVGEKLRVPL